MKAWRRSCMGLLAALWLSGCGGDDNGSAKREEAQVEPPDEVASEPAEAPAEVEPLAVEFRAEATLRDDRRLMVQGSTNLPDETRLLVVVEREPSGVRWQARTTVADERFAVGPLGPGSGLPDGRYILTVNLVEASIQPASVQERIGEEGEHLEGELVRNSRHGLGQVARYTRQFLIGSEPRRATDQVEVLEIRMPAIE